MEKKENNQQELMELVVDKVLKKHGVLKKKGSLDKKEKKKIVDLVENIKADVEHFLENTKVAKTEKDFSEMSVDQDVVEVVEQTIKKNRQFKGENDLSAVKRFLGN